MIVYVVLFEHCSLSVYHGNNLDSAKCFLYASCEGLLACGDTTTDIYLHEVQKDGSLKTIDSRFNPAEYGRISA